jgi:hypothetical protein
VHFENGCVVEYCFRSATSLERVVLRCIEGASIEGGDTQYSATSIRTDFYLVNWRERGRSASASTLLLDMKAGICTLVHGSLPTRLEVGKSLMARAAAREELTGVNVQFWAGCIGAAFSGKTARHSTTTDLVGMRVEYTYSATERYEHIYLNDHLYTWHCLDGSERGLADTDRCHYLKLGPQLFLFVWREKIVPTLGVVVVDLRQRKTTGCIVGYESFDFGAITSFPVGARVRVLDGPDP